MVVTWDHSIRPRVRQRSLCLETNNDSVSNFRTFEEHTAGGCGAGVVKDRYYRPLSSEPSSVPTTSDEETVERPKTLVGMSDGDTSTMESAQIVDR